MTDARRFDLLVFDWDGTLMDSAGAIVASVQAACRDLGLPEPSDEAARYVIGLGLSEALAVLVPQLPLHRRAELVERYRSHFLARYPGIALFEGARETIEALHAQGYRLAVATGKSRRGLSRALETTGLARYFHGSRCADECFSKPHPAMLHELLEEFGVEPGRALMIGDTVHDLQMARNAGVAALAVAYGAHPKPTLMALEPLACVDSLGELRRWLATHA
ncbi:HAD-IA family hydrolase [Pelomicrobium methylotrophicum]|uniref:HAD-IA family hydrolase n=1 Tax=Pelomicrobium methylotrophicum TaxID=2602750 RepID=A0A5C7F2C1_9PROT|nr:HAD-IA family hydrolase [Pelomicrobium methylotrophicum]TXF13647.1 HAD-IA family hydrolase [Pelomicrobium methylotrophicum]